MSENFGGHNLNFKVLTNICEDILKGKLPKINELLLILLSKLNFKISAQRVLTMLILRYLFLSSRSKSVKEA